MEKCGLDLTSSVCASLSDQVPTAPAPAPAPIPIPIPTHLRRRPTVKAIWIRALADAWKCGRVPLLVCIGKGRKPGHCDHGRGHRRQTARARYLQATHTVIRMTPAKLRPPSLPRVRRAAEARRQTPPTAGTSCTALSAVRQTPSPIPLLCTMAPVCAWHVHRTHRRSVAWCRRSTTIISCLGHQATLLRQAIAPPRALLAHVPMASTS